MANALARDRPDAFISAGITFHPAGARARRIILGRVGENFEFALEVHDGAET
jgi:hypothetical protein